MADNHRPLRVPRWLWDRYDAVVAPGGRPADLRLFMDWQADNPDQEIGPDVDGPHDLHTTLRVESELWNPFLDAVPARDGCARLRGYIWWRVRHPRAALPQRRREPVCV